MRLERNEGDELVVRITSEEQSVITGLFGMISAIPNPAWWTSFGDDDNAITPDQFDRVYDAWSETVVEPFASKQDGG